MKHAIDVIHAEHNAIAAVLTGLQSLVEQIETGRSAPDFELLGAMIQYLTELPDQVHHPKEDQYLFTAVRRHSPETAAILDELEGEHRNGPAEWAALSAALAQFRRDGVGGIAAFQQAVARYCDFQWKHLAKEERYVIPVARKVLPPAEMASLDAAFAANDNPWEGAAGKFRNLFTRIVAIAPSPIGVGPSGRKH